MYASNVFQSIGLAPSTCSAFNWRGVCGMEGSVCKPEIGGGLARHPCHKAMFGFFDHMGSFPTTKDSSCPQSARCAGVTHAERSMAMSSWLACRFGVTVCHERQGPDDHFHRLADPRCGTVRVTDPLDRQRCHRGVSDVCTETEVDHVDIRRLTRRGSTRPA